MAKKSLFYVILTASLGSTLLNPSAQNLCKKSSGQVKWVAGSSCGGGGWSPINNTLRSGHYRAGSIQDVHISASANIAWTKVAKPSGGIPGSDIATGAIDSSKISDNSIAAIDIGTGAVGQDELEDDSVSTTEIVNETIQNEDIA
ncbi:MAG: hypothetical protein NZO16_08110, partial [Deltaproteobacteria bacterium]|nr:hypothetical protein [Deltaproteobacteria bacterium]